MILTIHQPNYIPWLGFFHKVILSDTYVAFDDVQFEKNSFNNRNKVKINDDNTTWLTIPIRKTGDSKNITLKSAQIDDNSNWKKKHFKTLKYNYSKTNYYDKYIGFFEDVYNRNWESLSEINIYILKWLFEQLNIKTKIVLSSDIEEKKGSKDDLVLNICNYFNTDLYISGENGKDYIEGSKFEEEKVKIHYQNYNHPKYDQFGEKFVSHLSVLDLLFNYGPDSKKIIMKNNIDQQKLIKKYNLKGSDNSE